MERKARLSALFFFIAATMTAGVLSGAETGAADFPYKAAIDGRTVKNDLYRAVLGAEALEKCGSCCRGARVIDSAGREIPFVILEERAAHVQPEYRPLEVLSLDEKNGRTTITLKRGTDDTDSINRMDIATTDRDFHKLVAISGSNDRVKWEDLGQDSIYDYSSRVGLRHTTIVLKENGYRFFQFIMKDRGKQPEGQKLRLRYEGLDFSTAGPTGGKISIKGFAVSHQKEGKEETKYDEAAISPVVTHDDKKRTTEVLIDTALPVETVIFGIDNPYYLRTVTVYGSKANKKDDMVRLCKTTIFNLSIAGKKEIKDHVDIPPAAGYRYRRIVIEDGANPPLKLERVTLRWVRKQLFFFALDDDRQYWLYAGGMSAPPVTYDIASVVRADNMASYNAQTLLIGPVVANSAYAPAADAAKKAQKERLVLTSVIMLLVVLAAFFLYGLWKKASKRDWHGSNGRDA